MNFASKMMKFVLKMMNFVRISRRGSWGKGVSSRWRFYITNDIFSLKTDDLSSKTMNSGIKNDEFCAARQVAMGQGQAEKAMVLLKVCIKTR